MRGVGVTDGSDPRPSWRVTARLGLDNVPDPLGGLLRMSGLVDDDVVVLVALRHPTLRVASPSRERLGRLAAAASEALARTDLAPCGSMVKIASRPAARMPRAWSIGEPYRLPCTSAHSISPPP